MDHGLAGARAPWTRLVPLRGRPNLSNWLQFGRPRRTGKWKGSTCGSNDDRVAKVRLVGATAQRRSLSVSGEVEAEAASLGDSPPESGRQRGSDATTTGGGNQRSLVRRRFKAQLVTNDCGGGREEVGDLILAFTRWREVVESAGVGVEGWQRVEFIGAVLRVRRGEGTGGSKFERWLGGS
jgi:hypothetical protein